MDREITATCQTCERTDSLTVDVGKHDRYLMREGLVQGMFPTFTKDEREIVINADGPHQRSFGHYICATCWPILFAEGDDDE